MKKHMVAGGEVLDQLHNEFKRYNIGYFKMAAEIARGHRSERKNRIYL